MFRSNLSVKYRTSIFALLEDGGAEIPRGKTGSNWQCIQDEIGSVSHPQISKHPIRFFISFYSRPV